MKQVIGSKVRVIRMILVLAFASFLPATVVMRAEPTIPYGLDGVTDSTIICIRPGIPFVWLRANHASDATPLMTLYPQDYLKLTTTQNLFEDSVQWWVEVAAFPSATRFGIGWVEANSLTTRCPADATQSNVPPHPNWDNANLCIKPGIPFIWGRKAPSSYSIVKTTLNQPVCSAGVLSYLDSVNGYYWDGVQWWVWIGLPPRISSYRFWIEARSLYPAPSAANNATS